MNLKRLIEVLQEKPPEDQEAEVEFAVITKEGRLITVDLSTQAKSLTKVLKMFKGV